MLRLLTSMLMTAVWGSPLPPGPAPEPMGGTRTPHPPPAWVSDGERSAWLGSGSYCWMRGRAGICVDGRFPRGPLLHVNRGDRLQFHFGFEPRAVHLTAPGVQTRLPATRTPSWTVRATRDGRFSLLVRARRGGDASYSGRLAVAP